MFDADETDPNTIYPIDESLVKATDPIHGKTVIVPPPATDAIVDEWFAKHFHGLGGRLDEFLHAHIRAAKEDLKVILARAHT